MNKLFHFFVCITCAISLQAQTLNSIIEGVDPSNTWSWNWDLITNQDQLIAVNENGTLNIRTNGVWENIEVDPDDPRIEPRGVATDEDGTIWFTTTERGLWTYKDGMLNNYNSSNSFLPVDNLRDLAIQNQILWISTDGLGLIRHDFSTDETIQFTTADYPDLKSDFNLDPYIDASDNVWFGNREFLTRISPDLEWTNEDMRTHISGARVNDIHIESETEVWLAMNGGGVVLYDGTNYNVIIQDQFDSYINVFKDSKEDVWLSNISTISDEGITVIRDNREYFFDREEISDIPSQVFEFAEYQDTVIAVGTIGNHIAKLVFNGPSSADNLDAATLTVFPNPASDEIHIVESLPKTNAKWVIRDLDGKTVLTGNSAPSKVDVSTLKSGVYILNLDTKDGVLSKKITIANGK